MDDPQTVTRTQFPPPPEVEMPSRANYRQQSARGHLIGLVLAVVLTLGMAVSLGSLLSLPSWESAVRVVGLGAVMIIILASPINGLLLWIMLDPYTLFWYLNIHMPAGIPDLSLRRLAVALLCIVWVAQLATRKRRLRRIGLVEVCMALFCIMAIPSLAAGSSGLSRSLQLFLDKLLIPFLVFVLAKNLYDGHGLPVCAGRYGQRDSAAPLSIASPSPQEGVRSTYARGGAAGAISAGLDRLTAALAVIEGYLCIVLFWEHLTGQPLFYQVGRTTAYTRNLRKIVGLLGSGAFLATILAMIAPIALYRFVRARSPFSRAVFGGMFAMAVIGNFFVYNRGAWLGLAIALVLLLLFEPEYRRILLPLILIAAVLVAVYWTQVTSSAVVTERLSNVNSINFRLSMLEVSQRMIRDNLLFGVGFDSFAAYYIQYGGHWELLAWDVPTPHNTYVLVLTTMGLVTFVPYVLLFLSLLVEMGVMMRRFWRERGSDRALFVSGWAVVAAYAASAVAMDIYANTFTSLVFFCITGTIIGHASHLRARQRDLVAERQPQAESRPLPGESTPSSPLAERA